MSEKKAVRVVEDAPQNLDMIGEMLEGDYLVLKAEGIVAGYSLFQEHCEQIQAILMDGDMPPGPPEMRTTVDLVRMIRRDGFSGMIIAISGDNEQQEKLCAPGLCDYKLAKPFRRARLLELLHQTSSA